MDRKKTKYSGVYEVGHGKYEISFYADKRRVWDTVYVESSKEANDLRHQKRMEAKSNPMSGAVFQIDDTVDFSLVIEGIVSGLIAAKKPSKTISKFKKVFNRLVVEFPKARGIIIKSPSQINLIYLERYSAWYGGEKGRSSGLRAELIIVKSIIKRMYRFGFIRKALLSELGDLKLPPRSEGQSAPNIPRDKLEKLFAYMKKDNPWFYDFYRILLLTGRRPQEIILLERRDIEWGSLNDPVRVWVRAETTKMRTGAPIDIHPKCDIALKNAIVSARNRGNAFDAPYLFVNRVGKRLSQTTLRNYLLKVSSEVIGQRVNMKHFRKRYATQCGINRVPLKDAMRRSGHKDVAVFVKNYQQSSDEGLAAVINAVEV